MSYSNSKKMRQALDYVVCEWMKITGLDSDNLPAFVTVHLNEGTKLIGKGNPRLQVKLMACELIEAITDVYVLEKDESALKLETNITQLISHYNDKERQP